MIRLPAGATHRRDQRHGRMIGVHRLRMMVVVVMKSRLPLIRELVVGVFGIKKETAAPSW